MAIDSNDGLPGNNRLLKRVGPIVTPQQLKDVYLFGVTIFDDEGNPLKDEAYQTYIDNAVSMIEHYLDISITPECITEQRDYRVNDYSDWGYMQLNNFPIVKVNKVQLVYFRDEDGEPQVIQEIPKNWIRIQKHDGILRLVPNARFPANLQIDNTGNYFPEVLRSTIIPHAWQICYEVGFEDGKIPNLINQAIALTAAIQALIIAGNLVIGAGIASQSISLDGLSQSVVTTASAENSSYSATIKEYQGLLFGNSVNDKNGIIYQLKEFYKGQTIGII